MGVWSKKERKIKSEKNISEEERHKHPKDNRKIEMVWMRREDKHVVGRVPHADIPERRRG